MTWISNPTAIAEPGMWHLRKEPRRLLEFVHRRTGEVVVLAAPTHAPAFACLKTNWMFFTPQQGASQFL